MSTIYFKMPDSDYINGVEVDEYYDGELPEGAKKATLKQWEAQQKKGQKIVDAAIASTRADAEIDAEALIEAGVPAETANRLFGLDG